MAFMRLAGMMLPGNGLQVRVRADDRALRRVDDDPGSLTGLRVDRPEVGQQFREVAVPHRRGRHAEGILELFPIPVALRNST